MRVSKKCEVLDKATKCDDSLADKHLKLFFENFMRDDAGKRWVQLALKRSERASRDSHKIIGRLDMSLATKIDNFDALGSVVGVFWDFRNAPVKLSAEDAFLVGEYEDAIFSIIPGHKAVFFFHHGDVLLLEC